MELTARTAQLAMLGGKTLNRTPSAGVFKYKSPWGTGTLYVFAESRGPDSEYVCRMVVETIGKEFKASNRSLTASLAAAIKAAHQVLLAENRQSLRDHRATVGVTCATVRDGELFFAQAGPAVAYALLGGQITRIPAASSRTLPSWSTPLGGGDTIDISLARYDVQPHDVVLMASSLLASKPVEGELPSLLTLGPKDVLRQLEQFLSGEPAFSALSIVFEAASRRGQRVVTPVSKDPPPKKGRATTTSVFSPAASMVAAVRSKLRRASVDKEKASKAMSVFLPDNGSAPVERAPKPSGKRRASASSASRQAPDRATAAKATEEDTLVMVWSSRAGTVRGGTVEERYRTSLPQTDRNRARNLRLLLFLVMILLAGLLACSVVTYFTRFADKQGEEQFDRALNSATVARERAIKTGDLAESRSLLNDAGHLVNEALSINKNDPKARALKQKIAADLANLNAVVKLPETKVLTDLSKVEGGAKNVTSLIVEGEDAFILDRGNSKVYQFVIDLASGTLKVGKSMVVVKKGDRVGDATVSDLVSILWMSAGGGRQSNNLLIFDSARNLFEYTPGKGLAQLKVRGAQSWINPALALGYNSNLYILDPSASQVWRYFSTFNGYDSEMRGLLENADIKDAVDFAIDRDIFVLTRGGKVLKFVGGRLETFNQDQLDKGLANPTAIFTTSKTKFVYVVDAGNNRVVVFTEEGKFQRQLVGEALEESPRSIHVDEERGKIYILGDKKLYLSSLPN